MIPVRCFTCNNIIAQKWDEYSLRISNGQNEASVLNDMHITRFCCRRMFLTHVEVINDIVFYGNTNEILDESHTKFFGKAMSTEKISCD